MILWTTKFNKSCFILSLYRSKAQIGCGFYALVFFVLALIPTWKRDVKEGVCHNSPNGGLPEFVLTVASALMYHPEVRIFLFLESITGGC